MTKLLLNLFVKEKNNLSSLKVRSQIGRLSGIVGILCNLLLFAGKITIGMLSGSVSITADAMNNLSDASSSVITFLGFKLAEKPADEDHPYGHARFEYLSALFVAAIIIVIGFELAKTSIEKIINPTEVLFSIPVAIVLILSILVKLWLSVFNGKLGKMINSATLQAASSDSRNDVVSTLAVLVASVLQFFFDWRVDGIIGLLVAIFILYSGAMLGKETISPLLGEAGSQELRELIAEVIKSNPKVLGYHDLMVHDYGPGQRFASMHIEMDSKEDPIICHDMIDDLEREIYQNYNVHIVIHYDPVCTGDAELDRLKGLVLNFIKEYDNRLTMHDFRMVCGSGHTNLIFDVALPFDLNKKDKEIKQFIDKKLADLNEKTYYTVINFDPAIFN